MDDTTIIALARARRAATAASNPDGQSEFNVRLIAAELRDALNVLDNAGIFHEIDEAADYASAEEVLAEAALLGIPKPDPAEWGDTTAADMARHQGLELTPERYR